MIVVFDLNVILDSLLDRDPYGEPASELIDAAERSRISGFVCAASLPTLFYLLQKATSRREAYEMTGLILRLFDIAPVNRSVLEKAHELGSRDFEDAVVYQSALAVNADAIVTRNPRDYPNARIPIYSPVELLAAISGSG